MGAKDLLIELKENKKTLKTWRFKPQVSSSVISIGSSNKADIKVFDENWQGIDCCFYYENDQWKIIDLNENRPLDVYREKNIEENFCKDAGKSCLQFSFLENKDVLFSQSENSSLSKENKEEIKQQIIFIYNNKVYKTIMTKANQKYKFFYNGKKEKLQPVDSKAWQEKRFGNLIVKQRLVCCNDNTTYLGQDNDLKIDKFTKGIYLLTLFLCLLLPIVFKVILRNDEKPKPEMAFLDEKKIKAFQTRLKVPKVKKKAGGAINRVNNDLKKIHEKTQQEVSKGIRRGFLKKTGLNSLIGKISKRAGVSSKLIFSSGKKPNIAGTGKALTSLGRLNKNKDSKVWMSGDNKGWQVNTAGRGGGNNNYFASGNLDTSNIGKGDVGIVEEETEIYGGLSKDIIQKYVKKNIGQILYCYERQLTAHPDLSGKVEVKFVIAGNGKVISQQVLRSNLKSPIVEKCILGNISKWRFPAPEGGTKVIVNYPFLFKSVN